MFLCHSDPPCQEADPENAIQVPLLEEEEARLRDVGAARQQSTELCYALISIILKAISNVSGYPPQSADPSNSKC